MDGPICGARRWPSSNQSLSTRPPRRLNQPAPRLDEWTLWEWIVVLGYLGHFSPTIEKFGHALRDFRNYVHPGAELRKGFALNHHTALIGFQVVLAAVDDLSKSGAKKEEAHG